MYGWCGRILRIDLTTKKVSHEKIDSAVLKKFIGGRGLAVKILYDETDANTDPLGPENRLIFAVGPVNGTPLGSGRMSIVTKSPFNNFLADGNIGGHFAPQIKYCGIDAIVVQGASAEPVYVVIDNDEVKILAAEHLWGKTCSETESILHHELGDGYQFRYIGPAGENKVYSATVMGHVHRAGGRNGGGAVMGAKKLKAIAIRGNGAVEVADSKGYLQALKEIWHDLNPHSAIDIFLKPWGIYGDSAVHGYISEFGGSPVHNDQEGLYKYAADIGPEKVMLQTESPKSCFGCAIGSCANWVVPKEGKNAGRGLQIHAGSILALGGNFGITNLSDVLDNHWICNDLGLDNFAAYAASWAFEAYEKGIITKEDTGGLELKWGDNEAVQQLLRMIVYRQGIGDLLANGGVYAASVIAGGAGMDFALGAKGVDFSGVSPRAFYTMGLVYAVNDAGSDHTRVYPPYPPLVEAVPADIKLPFDMTIASDRHSPREKGSLVKWLFDTRAVLNCLETCVYNSRGRLFSDQRPFAKALTACTGVEYTAETFLTVGERVCNLERSYNVRNGAGRKDDTISKRWTTEAYSTGGSAGKVVPLEEMVDDYYQARGWNRNGIPLKATLDRLDLGDVAADLKAK